MSRASKNTLTKIANNEKIGEKLMYLLYKKEKLTTRDTEYLYSVSLFLIAEYEKQSDKEKYFLFVEYAYAIIAITSFKTKKFNALYDFSTNFGFYPISRKIIELDLLEEKKLSHLISNVAIDGYELDGKIMTQEQSVVLKTIQESAHQNISFIAPTSYGKSEMIYEHILKNNYLEKIAIIVPTKALIDQVYGEAKKIIKNRKIIMHDQNYSNKDKKVLAVVTQERGIRLIEEGIVFNIIYIDEAHQLFDFDYRHMYNNRSLILARFINMAKKKNSRLRTVYLSPLIEQSENLELDDVDSIETFSIIKNLKILDINFLDLEGNHYKYDKFLGKFFTLKTLTNKEYILKNSCNKNIHFLYKPKMIEEYCKKLNDEILVDNNNNNNIPSNVLELIDELKELVHPRFLIAKYLEKGILYLHGKVPELIKNYLLKCYKEYDYIKHIVANSVILAGMNLPIDNLFYISGNSNMRDLNNLIGRVNRMNEIFDKNNDDLSRIIIPIHFLEMSEFEQHRGSMKNKIKKMRDNTKDSVKNPMLKNAKIETKTSKKSDAIRKVEREIINTMDNPTFESKLIRAGAQQLLNYTKNGLLKLEERLKKTQPTTDMENIMELIKTVFFDGFDSKDYEPQPNAWRLRYKETVEYYKMFIQNMNSKTLSERIADMVKYWKEGVPDDYQIYVGPQFGEVERISESYGHSKNVYVNYFEHKHDEDYLHNLALLKIQTDEDFVRYEISLLLNTFSEFDIIGQDRLDQYYYGTSDIKVIRVLKSGVTRSLSNQLEKDDMIKYIEFNEHDNILKNVKMQQYMETKKGIMRYELEKHFD